MICTYNFLECQHLHPLFCDFKRNPCYLRAFSIICGLGILKIFHDLSDKKSGKAKSFIQRSKRFESLTSLKDIYFNPALICKTSFLPKLHGFLLYITLKSKGSQESLEPVLMSQT